MFTALIVIGVAGGFWILGTPDRQRRYAEDEERVADLRLIATAINLMHYDALPSRLAPNFQADRLDGTSVPLGDYKYRRLDRRHFRLCAQFLEPSQPDTFDFGFGHGKGWVCYIFATDDSGGPIRPLPQSNG